jgi:DNA-binding transcriptional LysR family regulator
VDRIELMSAFVRVVEVGSLSRAARTLKTTQPTVSKWVARLERHLGVKLLQRNTRGVRLTEAGERYFRSVRRILKEIDTAEEAVQTEGKGVTGRLKLSVPVGLGELHLAHQALELRRQFPGLKLELSLNDQVVDLVRDGVDLAIRLGGVTDPDVVARALGAFTFCLTATPRYLREHGTPATPQALSQHPYLTYGGGPWEVLTTPGGAVRVRVQAPVEVDNHQALRAAVLSSAGIGRTLRWLVHDDLKKKRLQEVLPGVAPEPFPVHAVYLPARKLPEKLRVAVAFFTASVKKIPGWVPPRA